MEIFGCFFKLPTKKQRKWTQENSLKGTSKVWLQPIKARKSVINGSTKTSAHAVIWVWSEVIATIWNGLVKNESSFNVTHHYYYLLSVIPWRLSVPFCSVLAAEAFELAPLRGRCLDLCIGGLVPLCRMRKLLLCLLPVFDRAKICWSPG